MTVVLSWPAMRCGFPDDQFRVRGTVQLLEVEGGCWRVLGADGTAYEPVNLPLAFREHGLSVSMIITPAMAGSYCQVGELVEIVHIERH
jgi:hypothetical protein